MAGLRYDTSQTLAVDGTSNEIGALVANQGYLLTSTVDAWFKTGTGEVTAQARTDDSHLIVAGQIIPLRYTSAVDIAIIKDDAAADGYCCLSKVEGGDV